MQKLIVKKLILIALCICALVSIDIFFVKYCIQSEMDLVVTYVASHDISPRTLISQSDIVEITIPRAYVQEYAYQSKEDIVGKYTEIQGMIPAGSLFYRSMLYEQSELPDDSELQLRSGQSVFNLETGLSDSGNMVAGQRVDLHLTVTKNDGTVLTGCILKNVRIVTLKDHQGLSILDVNSSKIPYMASLAIDAGDIELVTMAQNIGKLRMFASSSSYSTDKEATRDTDSVCLQYVVDLMSENMIQKYVEDLK